ncbi:tetratricopeptide repeat protein [Haliangium ochraceum]|uniref:Tetratricopeptide TPR_2 repeat protein n=1 Tax=Haliangium ochraceum (strain DSM 14365 / JCM 11303 / SMP-2) TaxID=502025 RepID=D0LZB4_HALO1|nr:tetratricopeptide repeat protein [Haliangium ochraceum]ACY16376.1 Tetratricopeptide TPR_2 repeat protein [Haliangium ochraceum DSM 14365]
MTSTEPSPRLPGTRLARCCFAALALLLALPAPAAAQKAGPRKASPQDEEDPERRRQISALFRKAQTAYDLREFDQAIEYFKELYTLSPHEAFLYNIAQSYRQAGDCQNALYFYKRYVAVGGPEADHYEVVQRRIKELAKNCEVIDEMKSSPPLDSLDPERGDGEGDAQADEDDDEAAADRDADADGDAEDEDEDEERDPRDAFLTGAFEAGAARFLDLGELEIENVQFAMSLSAGYPLRRSDFEFTFGGALTYARVGWENVATAMEGTTSLTGVLGNVSGRYWITRRLSLHLETGVGILLLGGLENGNVFTPPSTFHTGTASLFHVRAATGIDFSLTKNLALRLSPVALSFSDRTDDLRPEVDRLLRLDIVVGIGYRM